MPISTPITIHLLLVHVPLKAESRSARLAIKKYWNVPSEIQDYLIKLLFQLYQTEVRMNEYYHAHRGIMISHYEMIGNPIQQDIDVSEKLRLAKRKTGVHFCIYTSKDNFFVRFIDE